MKWYLKALRSYAEFRGRARRTEFWMFVLFNMLFAAIASLLDSAVGMADPETGLGPIAAVYSLAMLLPNIAVAVRRLHDVGKSGWFLFIVLLPLIGAIWLIILYARNGDTGTNKYGPDPKEEFVA